MFDSEKSSQWIIWELEEISGIFLNKWSKFYENLRQKKKKKERKKKISGAGSA